MFVTKYQDIEYCFYDDHMTVAGTPMRYSEMLDITHKGGSVPSFLFTYGDRRFTLPYNPEDRNQIVPYFLKANKMQPEHAAEQTAPETEYDLSPQQEPVYMPAEEEAAYAPAEEAAYTPAEPEYELPPQQEPIYVPAEETAYMPAEEEAAYAPTEEYVLGPAEPVAVPAEETAAYAPAEEAVYAPTEEAAYTPAEPEYVPAEEEATYAPTEEYVMEPTEPVDAPIEAQPEYDQTLQQEPEYELPPQQEPVFVPAEEEATYAPAEEYVMETAESVDAPAEEYVMETAESVDAPAEEYVTQPEPDYEQPPQQEPESVPETAETKAEPQVMESAAVAEAGQNVDEPAGPTKSAASSKLSSLMEKVRTIPKKTLLIIAIAAALVLAAILFFVVLGGGGKSIDGIGGRVKTEEVTGVTGEKQTIAEINDDAAVEDYAVSYYKKCFNDGNNVHWVFNKKTNETVMFADHDGTILIVAFDTVEGEKDDPNLYGTGAIKGTWILYEGSNELVKI